MEGEIVDDYAARIRHAREAKGLSQKDLAMLLKEKEHLIKKIENAELIPEDAVRKKLEKALEIRLVDAPEADADKKVQSKTDPDPWRSHHHPQGKKIIYSSPSIFFFTSRSR